MQFIKNFKLKNLLRTAIFKTDSLIKEKEPKFVEHYIFGDIKADPKNLVVWYVFETKDDLIRAKKNGLTNFISNAFLEQLKENGYPREAISDKFSACKDLFFENAEEKGDFFCKVSDDYASVCFSSLEEFNEKSKGKPTF